ncbi:MAG: leucine-rich repeat domain-containing protein [Clostridium sp.]
MNKNVKMLVLGYITIAQFTMLSASVTANANELQDENVTEIIESIDNTDNVEEYINEDIIGEDEVDKNQEDEVDKNQIVNIPDENLRKNLLKELGLKEEDNITISQLETITKLNLHGRELFDLTGLEYCKNLIELTCSWSSVSDLTPLKKLVKLEKIVLNGNKISDISVLKNLVNLKKLSIGNNDISDISVLKNLINLEYLDLYNNNISDISVLKNLVNLKNLYIDDNKINDISVLRNLVNLEHLNLINAGISDISPIENLINLKALNLSENEISDISPLRDLVNLEHLNLSDNNIIDISPIKNLTKLISFWAYNNKINDISALENLINLQDVLLIKNNITGIKGIEKLDKIIKLDLSNNKIKNIDALENSPIYKLYLDDNEIQDISVLSTCNNLIELQLSKNKISDISSLSGLHNLRYLALDNNEISDISPLTELQDLRSLYLNNNNISDISCIGNYRILERIGISNNKISDISVLENRRLQELAINNNPITNIDLSKNYSHQINIDTEQQKYIKNYEDSWTDINIVLNPIKEVGTSIKIKNPIEYVSMDKVRFENAIYNEEDNTLFIDNIDSTSKTGIYITYWAEGNTSGHIIIPIEKEPELDEEINVEIPEHIKDIIDTTIVTPVSGNGLKENPLILEAKEVSVDKVKELVNSFDKANVVCETIENDGTYTKYKFKLVNSITRSLDETYFTIIVANSQIDIINLLNNHYEIKNDDANNGNDSDEDNSNNSSSAGGSGGTDESDGNGGTTGDNTNITIPEEIKDIIDTTIVTPVSGNGLKENPLILEAKEVSVDKVKELVNSFDKANVVCETIENDGTYTKYKFKLVNSITRSLDETYFTIVVANSQIDIINLLNNHYEIKNDDANNGNDSDEDNSNNSSSAGGSGGTDESDGNGGATGDNTNITIPEEIKDIIDTTIVTPVSGNGLKENPLILEAKEVSVDKVKELVNSFDKANVVCETIENDGTYTKYKFKLVNSITRSLDETYFTIIVANSQIDIINLLNNHYEIKNDDTNNGNDNDKDNSNNSSSTGGSEGTDESDGNGGATEDNLNKNEGTANDSIIVKPENNTNQDANNKVESNISKLPVTGQAVASSLFVAFGTFLTGVGTFISRKKKR